MKNSKPLIVDKRDRVKGLYTYCNKCKRVIDNRVCGETGKRITSCKNSEKHLFRATIPVPGTNGKKRKVKLINTKDLDEAIRIKIEFENSLKNNGYQSKSVEVNKSESKPTLLIECMAMYIGYLNNEGVASHLAKQRSKKHLWEVENYFGKFCRALKHFGIDHTIIKVDQINDQIVSHIHTFILEELKHSNKTYNKMIALYRQFLDWLIVKNGYQLNNPFSSVHRRKETRNKEVVSKEEFQRFLEVITPEHGYQILSSGERKMRYRNWLKHCFIFALETGLRREEFLMVRYSDIKYDENHKPLYLEVDNYKVNRIKGEEQSDERKFVPITKGLLKLLNELEFEKNKGSSDYLIGSDETMSRRTMIDFVSKAFSHFWKLTGLQKNIQLKHLRKTYLTALVGQLGEKATAISNHSGLNVLKKHYVNDQQLIATTKSFSVFDE